MQRGAIGFIGSGRITRIVLHAWKNAGFDPGPVKLFDKDPQATENLSQQYRGKVFPVPLIEGLSDCGVLFLAVHPPVMVETLSAIKPYLHAETLVVSLAPKITLAAMNSLLGGHRHLARVNPSATGIVGLGLNPYCISDDASPADSETIKHLLSPLGTTVSVDEAKIEAYALISAMGPTYFWFQFAVLQKLAVQFGMDEAEAKITMEQMLSGAVKTMYHSGLTTEQVIDLVPVKPLALHEAAIQTMFHESLTSLHAKIKP